MAAELEFYHNSTVRRDANDRPQPARDADGGTPTERPGLQRRLGESRPVLADTLCRLRLETLTSTHGDLGASAPGRVESLDHATTPSPPWTTGAIRLQTRLVRGIAY